MDPAFSVPPDTYAQGKAACNAQGRTWQCSRLGKQVLPQLVPSAISWHSSIQLVACTDTFQGTGTNRAWWKLAYFIKFLKGEGRGLSCQGKDDVCGLDLLGKADMKFINSYGDADAPYL